MSNEREEGALTGFIIGITLYTLFLGVSGNWPRDVYQRGVKDCAAGLATVEVVTDSIVVKR